MSNIIRISRNAAAEISREVALIALSSTDRIKHYAGQLVMSKYYTNYEEFGTDSPMDTILAIGISEGYGANHYRIVSISADKIVRGIRIGDSEIPDVAECINDEVWLWKSDEGIYYFVYNCDINENGVYEGRTVEPIGEGPYHFVNAEDGFSWFYFNGVLRAEYDYYTQSEVNSLIAEFNTSINTLNTRIDNLILDADLEFSDQTEWLTELDSAVFTLSTSLSSSKTQYLMGESGSPVLTIAVTRKSVDVVSDCTFTLNGTAIEFVSKKYTVPSLTTRTTLSCITTYVPRGITSTDSVTIDFGYYFWYGLIPEGTWEITQTNIFALTQSSTKASTSSSTTVPSITSSGAQRYAFVYPAVYGDITSIYDGNGFDNTDGFEKSGTISLTISGLGTFSYYVYTKTAAAVFEGISLTFNY